MAIGEAEERKYTKWVERAREYARRLRSGDGTNADKLAGLLEEHVNGPASVHCWGCMMDELIEAGQKLIDHDRAERPCSEVEAFAEVIAKVKGTLLS